MRMYHNLHHPGEDATLEKVQAKYHWDTIRKDVIEYVKQCHSCQAVKMGKTILPPMDHIPVSDERFKDVQIDVVGPLPPSERMRYLLTMLDRTTRWLEAFPMAEANTTNCANAMVRGWIQRYGLPRVSTTDNGNTFIANLWKQVHNAIGIEVAYPPPPTIPAL